MSYKIDFTTMTDQPTAMPIKTITQQLGYGSTNKLTRIGNLVLSSIGEQYAENTPSDGAWHHLDETITLGFRPAYYLEIYTRSGTDAADYQILSSGSISLRTNSNRKGSWPNLNSVWITNDPWPTS